MTIIPPTGPNRSPPDFAGTHFMKVGVGLTHTTFDGRNRSNTVRILRRDGTISQQIDFVGDGLQDRNTTEFLRSFRTSGPSRSPDGGVCVRLDRDTIAHTKTISRHDWHLAFSPISDGRTVIRGGIGLFYDRINLNTATFSQLQDRLITSVGLDGRPVSQLQHRTVENGRFLTPRSVSWNTEFDREWLKNLLVRVGYQQRQATREYVLDPIQSAMGDNTLLLSNSGRSVIGNFRSRRGTRFAGRMS